jgi:hypothetical protein
LSVEKTLEAEPSVACPLCTDGRLARPPEDCGGIPGFYDMLAALANPSHENHAGTRDWIADFDPERFSVEAANKRLRRVFRINRHSTRVDLKM